MHSPIAHHPCLHCYSVSALLLCYALATPGLGHAQGLDIQHRVRAGDTLMSLASHYVGTPGAWSAIGRHNHITDPKRLRIGSWLLIPSQLLPVGSATVEFIQGQALLQQGGGARGQGAGQSQPLQAGTTLQEGAQLQVGADSFVSVRLHDGTLLRIQANSQVQLEQLRKRGRAGDAQSVIELQKGSIDSSVPKRPGSAEQQRRFEIRTPTASTSVRGTRFSTSLTAEGGTLSSVTEGSVQVDAGRTAQQQHLRLQAGQGVAVNNAGAIGSVQNLLTAPDLSALPDTLSDADFLTLALPAVPGAASYWVQVSQDADFAQTLRSGTFNQALARLPAVADGQYHIAARALNAAGLPGHISQRRIQVKAHPVAPAYLSPAAQAIIASATPAPWRCTEVAGATSYRLQLAGDSSFAQPLQDSLSDGQCAGQFAALPPGNYYWRIASVRTGNDQGPFGPPQSLQVQNAPTSLSAAQIALAHEGDQLQLRWPGAAGQSFQLQLSASQDFSAPLIDTTVEQPHWQPTGLTPGDYWLRIQTRDRASGLSSVFSPLRQLHLPAPIQSGTGLPITSTDGRALSRP